MPSMVHLQHARDCNPCPSTHTRFPSVPLVRQSHSQWTTRPDTLTDTDSPAVTASPPQPQHPVYRSSRQAGKRTGNVTFQFKIIDNSTRTKSLQWETALSSKSVNGLCYIKPFPLSREKNLTQNVAKINHRARST